MPSYQVNRALSQAHYGGGEFAEIIEVAQKIPNQNWNQDYNFVRSITMIGSNGDIVICSNRTKCYNCDNCVHGHPHNAFKYCKEVKDFICSHNSYYVNCSSKEFDG